MTEKIKGDIKMVTDYSFNEDGKKVKTVRHYKIERKMVPKIVAERRNWHKFGMSKDDKPGPNPQVNILRLNHNLKFLNLAHSQTTVVAEEIWMQLVANKQEHEKEQDTSALDTLAASKRGIVKCRICKEDHWTTQCPYKDTLGPLRESLTGPVDEADAAPGAAPAAAAPAPGGAGGGNK